MTITAVFVLFSVTWFLVLFLALQIKIKTQGEDGAIVDGTHASSPVNFDMMQRIKITTLVSIPLCALLVCAIIYDVMTLEMFEFLNFLEK